MKNSLTRLLITFGIFAAAMAYLESAIVVYLREIYYPGGFQFPLKIIQNRIAVIEIGREAATVIMLWFITRMATDKFKNQFALFIYAFGIWDIFYYLWLKIFIGWPAYFMEWDILFLIPLPWIGPWLAPVIVSIGFIASGVLVLKYSEKFPSSLFTWKEWIFMSIAAGIIIGSFLWETGEVLQGSVPDYYPWWLFFLGYILGWAVFIRRLLTGSSKNSNVSSPSSS
jgi:hypothetical protein